MVPEVGISIKESKFKSVDLPDPEGPIKEYILPALKENLSLFSTLIFFFL